MASSRRTKLAALSVAMCGSWSLSLAAAPLSPIEEGRRLSREILIGDDYADFRDVDSSLLRRLGGPARLKALIDETRKRAGHEVSLDYERVFRTGNQITYGRIAQFDQIGHAWFELTYTLVGARLTSFELDAEKKPASPFLMYPSKTRLGLPFGQPPPGLAWFVLWAGDKAADNYHARRETHFAVDFLPRPLPGDWKEKTVKGSPCWGLPIVAAADGVVAEAKDGMVDQPKLFAPNNSGGPGNYVVIDHGQGEFSLYGHLQKGSVRVRPGQKVSAGERLGLCGNSGASEIPHLHFQLQSRADIRLADGLPPIFYDYFSPVTYIERGVLARGQYVLPGPTKAPR